MDKLIASCIEDMKCVDGVLTLDAQIRAYDLLQALSEAVERGILPSASVTKEFCAVYEASAAASWLLIVIFELSSNVITAPHTMISSITSDES